MASHSPLNRKQNDDQIKEKISFNIKNGLTSGSLP